MTATLYELAGIRETLDGIFAEQDGEITPEQEATLDAWDGAFSEKVEKVALYIIEQLSHATRLKVEEDRLAARRKAHEGRAAWLKSYLERCMAQAGKTKVEGQYATVAMQKNAPSVVEILPTDAADFRNILCYAPALVRVVPESLSWNRDAIKDAAKAGRLPEDVAKRVAIQQGTSLRIR